MGLSRSYVATTHGEEHGGVGEPRLDNGGSMEEDVKAGERRKEGSKVGDIAKGKLEVVGGSSVGEGQKVAGATDECPHSVAFLQQTPAKAASQITRGSCHHHSHFGLPLFFGGLLLSQQ